MKTYKYRKTFTYDGRRYNAYGDTLLEVGQKMERKMRELEEGRKVFSGEMTLRSWAGQCIETYKTNQGEMTRQKFLERVDSSILKYIGDRPLKAISPMDCQHAMNQSAGMSRTQINDVYYALKFLFKHAYQNRLIKEDPTEILIKPKAKKSESRRALTPEEREATIKTGKLDRRYYLFLLMLLCGCRPSEASECKGSDMKTIEGRHMLHIRGTKTGNSDRLVPIPAELYDLIRKTPKKEHIAAFDGGRKIEYGSRHSVWKLFWNECNRQMGCRTYRGKILEPYLYPKDLSPYCLRHEYCTDLARKGIDIRMAQKLMGHASIQMTANIYTNFSQADILSAADILAQ